jgi:hypothetical protein
MMQRCGFWIPILFTRFLRSIAWQLWRSELVAHICQCYAFQDSFLLFVNECESPHHIR